MHELEMQIATLEGQQKELTAELEDPAAYEPGGRAVAINRELSAVSARAGAADRGLGKSNRDPGACLTISAALDLLDGGTVNLPRRGGELCRRAIFRHPAAGNVAAQLSWNEDVTLAVDNLDLALVHVTGIVTDRRGGGIGRAASAE